MLFAGRLSPEKGIRESSSPRREDMNLVVAGDGPLRPLVADALSSSTMPSSSSSYAPRRPSWCRPRIARGFRFPWSRAMAQGVGRRDLRRRHPRGRRERRHRLPRPSPETSPGCAGPRALARDRPSGAGWGLEARRSRHRALPRELGWRRPRSRCTARGACGLPSPRLRVAGRGVSRVALVRRARRRRPRRTSASSASGRWRSAVTSTGSRRSRARSRSGCLDRVSGPYRRVGRRRRGLRPRRVRRPGRPGSKAARSPPMCTTLAAPPRQERQRRERGRWPWRRSRTRPTTSRASRRVHCPVLLAAGVRVHRHATWSLHRAGAGVRRRSARPP